MKISHTMKSELWRELYLSATHCIYILDCILRKSTNRTQSIAIKLKQAKLLEFTNYVDSKIDIKSSISMDGLDIEIALNTFVYKELFNAAKYVCERIDVGLEGSDGDLVKKKICLEKIMDIFKHDCMLQHIVKEKNN